MEMRQTQTCGGTKPVNRMLTILIW